MAKKSQVPPTPEMTALPMSGGDSPLVIDLPDGQKLVVGNLAAGSVIEVATWRGTGRPDSRTSRLMLGMSTASQGKAEDAAPTEDKKSSTTIIQTVTGVLKGLLAKTSSALKAKRKSPSEKKESAPLFEKVTPAVKTTDSAEVDDWLNSILEKSAKKSAAQKSAEIPVEKATVTKPVKKAVATSTPKKKPAPKKKSTGRAR
jgi:hypothetical protein